MNKIKVGGFDYERAVIQRAKAIMIDKGAETRTDAIRIAMIETAEGGGVDGKKGTPNPAFQKELSKILKDNGDVKAHILAFYLGWLKSEMNKN